MDALSLYTGAPTVKWEDSIIFISVVESKIVTPRGKQTDIHVCFIQKIENYPFVPKYEKYNVIPSNMCNRPYPGSIISLSTKWMTGFILYLAIDT